MATGFKKYNFFSPLKNIIIGRSFEQVDFEFWSRDLPGILLTVGLLTCFTMYLRERNYVCVCRCLGVCAASCCTLSAKRCVHLIAAAHLPPLIIIYDDLISTSTPHPVVYIVHKAASLWRHTHTQHYVTTLWGWGRGTLCNTELTFFRGLVQTQWRKSSSSTCVWGVL